jgi:uncharacterized protein YukE
MANVTSVDYEYLDKLAAELRTTQQELNTRIEQFTNRSGISGKEYGTLSASGTAASHYQGNLEDMVNHLCAMRDELAGHADRLEQSARLYRDQDTDDARRVDPRHG